MTRLGLRRNTAVAGSGSDPTQDGDTVRQTIVETLEAPRLEDITTEAFVVFKEKREIYERRLEEKNNETGGNISATTYRNSISKAVVDMLVTARWVPAENADAVTEDQLKECVEERSCVAVQDYDLAQIQRDIQGVKMPTFGSLEMRVWKLGLAYASALEKRGYSRFIETRQQIAVEHIMRRITHPQLRKRLLLTMKLRKAEGFKKNYGEVMRELAKEAREIDRQDAARGLNADGGHDSDNDSHAPTDRSRNRRQRRKNDTSSRDGGDEREKKGSTGRKVYNDRGKRDGKRTKPSCLNPNCSEMHYMDQCKNTDDAEKKRLLDAYRKSKKEARNAKKHDGKITHIGKADVDDDSSLFSATFCDGAVEAVVLTDSGSDANIIPPSVLEKLVKADKTIVVEPLNETANYKLADASAASLSCNRKISASVLLRVRHGTNLVMRGIEWFVTDQETDYVFIGKRVLAAIGLDNRALLAAASDKHGGVLNVPELLKSRENEIEGAERHEGAIHSILQHRASWEGSTFHAHGGAEDDMLEDSDVYVDLGEDPIEELEAALAELVREAKRNGLSEVGATSLSYLLTKYQKIFRIRLGKSPPADVEPMRVRLEPDCRTVRMKSRRYPAEQREFLDKYMSSLVEMGFVYECPTAAWQAAPLLVPKKGSRANYRMAIDLRPVNAATIKESWPMPHLESEVNDFAGSSCFASLDFVSGYWQLPLHEDSYEACAVVTPKGVFASTRVLQGLANATSYFQRTVEPLFKDIRANMKAWLDDFNLHAKTEKQLLNLLEKFFSVCEAKGLFLSAVKCNLFARTLKWCGRIVSGDGYTMDPSRLDGLKDMDSPRTADELAQFIYCCRWMSIAIPNFVQLVSPLNDLLEDAYKKSGKRTKRSIKNISLQSLSWGTVHDSAFKNLQNTLRNSVKLSYPKTGHAICIYTDASDKYWSAVVTQTEKDELEKPTADQKHEPLAFLGAAFKGAQIGWSTFEKEGFAIFQTLSKMDYLFFGAQTTHIYTDHRNLLFVFAPLALEPSLGRHIVSKVQRWALFMSRFSYLIEHVDGEANVFADILTGWARGYRRENKQLKTIASLVLQPSEQIIPSPEDLVWPNMDDFREAQLSQDETPNLGTVKDRLTMDKVDRLLKLDGRIWIPSNAVQLQLKIMVISHSGSLGHRGQDATKSIVRENFWWKTMDKDVEHLVRNCIHCIISRSGQLIPRALSHSLHGDRPNEVVHIDFLYMGPGAEGKKYVLIIRDDLSSYVWLWPTESATSEATADALTVWIGCFGSMEWLVSDQGSHFKNQLVRSLTEEFRVQHHFTTAYSPWANGSVERVCREVLRACKALLSEWHLAPRDWPAVVECVQSVLNHAPVKRLGLRNEKLAGVYRSPLEVFTGHIPSRPLLRALPIARYKNARCADAVRAQQLINIDATQTALRGMHREVTGLTTASRKRSVDAHHRRTNVKAIDFGPGDFVLVRRATSTGHKLQFTWRGPRRVVAAKSHSVFEVEDLLNGKREVVHARRLRLYRADMDEKEVAPELLRLAAHTEATYQDASGLRDIRDNHGEIEVQVEWEGLPDAVDRTWEPLAQVHEDLPSMLEEFLNSGGERILKKRALAQCSFSKPLSSE